MGFEVFVQGFADGDAAALDESIVRRIASELGADADVFGPTPPQWSLTFGRPSMDDLAIVARLVCEADAVAYWPAHFSTAVVAHPSKAAHLPPGAFDRVVTVRTAHDIDRAIRASDE